MPSARLPGSASLAWAGGANGRHARGEWLLGAGPLVLAAALPVLLGVLRLQACWAKGWSGSAPFHRQCYTDLANTVQSADLGRGVTAYLGGEVRLDQPPLTGLVMSTLGGLVGGGEVLSTQRWFIGLWALLAIGLLGAVVVRTRTVADHPGADPVMLALAPVTALTVLLSPDLLGVALATAGILAWSARRPLVGGLVLGLGTMARSYPLLIVAAIVILVLARPELEQRKDDLSRLALGWLAGVGGVAVIFIGHPALLLQGWSAWGRAPAGLGSIWYAPTLGQAALPAGVTTALAVAGWVAALVFGALFVTGLRRPPTLAATALVIVAVVLMTGKSFPLQSSLWLVPLVALAGVRWRDHLIWAAAEGAHFVALWLYMSGLAPSSKGLPAGWYLLFLLIRLIAVGWLVRQVWEGDLRGTHGEAAADRAHGIPAGGLGSEGVVVAGEETAISGYAVTPGTLGRLPVVPSSPSTKSAGSSPVDNPHRPGSDAYPPVTEGP